MRCVCRASERCAARLSVGDVERVGIRSGVPPLLFMLFDLLSKTAQFLRLFADDGILFGDGGQQAVENQRREVLRKGLIFIIFVVYAVLIVWRCGGCACPLRRSFRF